MSGKGYVTVVGCGAVAEEGEAAADAEARMCPVLIASWAQCPLSSGDLAWHLNTRTSRRSGAGAAAYPCACICKRWTHHGRCANPCTHHALAQLSRGEAKLTRGCGGERRVWQRHPLEVRGRRAEKGGLMHGEASGYETLGRMTYAYHAMIPIMYCDAMNLMKYAYHAMRGLGRAHARRREGV
eukprot:2804337-Rhodomonas_salina.3